MTAYVHGFASLELADGFGLGGDVDAEFAYGVETLVSALERAEAVEAGRVARVAEEPIARSPGRMPDA